jgi:hypothetical protein
MSSATAPPAQRRVRLKVLATPKENDGDSGRKQYQGERPVHPKHMCAEEMKCNHKTASGVPERERQYGNRVLNKATLRSAGDIRYA